MTTWWNNMYWKENYSFTCKWKKKKFQTLTPNFKVLIQSQEQQHLKLPSTMFMTLLSILRHTCHSGTNSSFSFQVISTKPNKQETQILPAGFYLDSKPRMQITQRCFYCEKPLVSAKHKIRGAPSTDIIQWTMAHYSVLGIVQLVFQEVIKIPERELLMMIFCWLDVDK